MLSLFLLTTTLLLSSCADTEKDNHSVEYEITAIPTTELDSSGGECGQAKGRVSLRNKKIFGNMTDSHERTFGVAGSVNKLGQVSGGFAITFGNFITLSNVAKFNGKFDSSGGKGNWQDIHQCSGNWTAVKI